MARMALLTATALVLAVPAPGEAAVLDISDRQEANSCRYARAQAPVSQREDYAAACRRARSRERAAGSVTAAAATAFSYENPVFGSSFPDPGVLANGTADYYAYGTGGGFPIIKSSDLAHWERVGRAFAARPSWVVPTGDYHPWAPSVLRSPSACPTAPSPGCYFMYYVGLSAEHTPATHCIGVAWSLTPSGPFTDLGPIQADDGATDLAGRPPGCGDAGGYGNIDAAPFVDDDGSVYLYVSTSRRCAEPTTNTCPYEPVLSVYEMTDTPTRFASDRKPLLGATPGGWEQEPGHAAQIENPWVEKRGSTYYLFYSGGFYGASYGMGYATASSPTGDEGFPAFAKSPLNPILAETSEVLSPGGGSVTAGPDGASWLVYHGRAVDYSQPRTLRIDPLFWSGTSVSTPGPTTGPQTIRPDEPAEERPPQEEPPPAEEPGPEEPLPGGSAGVGTSDGTAPATEPTIALADLTAPGLALRGKRVQRARASIVLGVTATTEDLWSAVSGRVRVRGGRAYRLRGGGRSFVAWGATHLFRPWLSQTALERIRRALRRGRAVYARLRVAAHDAAGNASYATRTIRLSLPAARPSGR